MKLLFFYLDRLYTYINKYTAFYLKKCNCYRLTNVLNPQYTLKFCKNYLVPIAKMYNYAFYVFKQFLDTNSSPKVTFYKQVVTYHNK